MDAGHLLMVLQSAVGQAPAEAAKGITGADIRYAASLIGTGLAIIGVAGAGVGMGNAAGQAAAGVARNPQASGVIMRMMIIGQAVAESTAIYALLIAFLLFISK